MNRAEIQELLPVVILGMASPEERTEVQAALQTDLELREEYRQLELALLGLASLEAVAPPPALKTRLLEAARQDIAPRWPAAPAAPSRRVTMRRVSPARRRPWVLGLLATGLITALTLFALRPAAPVLMNASVVATTRDGGLIYANSGVTPTPAVLIRPDRSRLAVNIQVKRPCVFTDAVSSDGLSYLLDAGNAQLFIVDEATGKLVDSWPVPAGAASVAVQGDTVVVKGAISGTAVIFHKTGQGTKTMLEAQLAPSHDLSSQELMDATLIDQGRIYATHHMNGTVSVLDETTGRELLRWQLGGEPVALGMHQGALLVLDHAGRLLKLEAATGRVLQSLKLSGHPDRLSLMSGTAFISDRSGMVTAIAVGSFGSIRQAKLNGTPMDLAPMPGDHLAVALSQRGVIVLNRDLRQLEALN